METRPWILLGWLFCEHVLYWPELFEKEEWVHMGPCIPASPTKVMPTEWLLFTWTSPQFSLIHGLPCLKPCVWKTEYWVLSECWESNPQETESENTGVGPSSREKGSVAICGPQQLSVQWERLNQVSNTCIRLSLGGRCLVWKVYLILHYSFNLGENCSLFLLYTLWNIKI